MNLSPFLAALALAGACSSKAPPPTAAEPAAVGGDAAAGAALPAIAWQADGTLAVNGTWQVDPETWRWTAIGGGGREAKTPNVQYPETPPAASATAIREASGKWSAWAEPARICFIAMPVPGYVCAALPTAAP
jgi:hypothetical protein